MNTSCYQEETRATTEPGDITRILNAVSHGETNRADALMTAMYARLWKLAARKMGPNRPGQPLQATALVNEAWTRHAASNGSERIENRAYFFAAAAEAMQRILVELARRKLCEQRSGLKSAGVNEVRIAAPMASHEELLAVSEALDRFATHDPGKAELVKLCYFAGLSMEDAAAVLRIPVPTANLHWTYARAWLQLEITRSSPVQLVSLSTEPSEEGWTDEPWTGEWRDETWTR
jgi:RNA polymerase sigma factor (TIGR02999 family)